ncbi:MULTISPECIES: PIN-like domain-containing protein [unclassified Brevibacillus]|uniref:PIN-like domain-containing protein n=1 Tax=unclassified Brevibacillus TaxID=2684853 RepID=UPI00356675C4
MRTSFPGYYKPSEAELQDAWKDCLIVLDANVMLNLYRYTDSTRETLLKVIELHADKIWIPHQVAFEFHFNRITVIDQQFKAYDKVRGIVAAIPNSIAGELGKFSKHPIIDTKEIISSISEITEKISGQVISQKGDHPNLLNNDLLGEALTNILQEKVGEPFNQEQLNDIYKEGALRYEREIPPGYKDNKKQEVKYFRDLVIESKFGDLIVWKQIIQKALEVKKPIILVTDDIKEDWWQRLGGITLGPRPELVDEMMVTTGNKFYMYQTDKFIEVAEKQLDEGSSQAIEEVRAMREFDETNEVELDTIVFETKHQMNIGHNNFNSLKEEAHLKEMQIVHLLEAMHDMQKQINIFERTFKDMNETMNNDSNLACDSEYLNTIDKIKSQISDRKLDLRILKNRILDLEIELADIRMKMNENQ